MPEAVMIFAAGFGTRMKPLTDDRPKPLIEVAGRPLVDHTLELVRAVAPARIVANLHYLPEKLEQHLAGQDVTLIREEPDILDTGGGLRNAVPLLGDGPVWTTNTDAIWGGANPFEMLRAAWDPARMDALMIAVDPAKAVGHQGAGDFTMAEDGKLARGPGMIYGGVQIIKTEGLGQIAQRAFSLNLLWDLMLAEGRLFGLRYPGSWCDVGHPGGIALAEQMIAARDV
ncbi:MAG: nucleotidyltransferase family protein [Sulfitobacter sp.]